MDKEDYSCNTVGEQMEGKGKRGRGEGGGGKGEKEKKKEENFQARS